MGRGRRRSQNARPVSGPQALPDLGRLPRDPQAQTARGTRDCAQRRSRVDMPFICFATWPKSSKQ